MQEIWKDVPGYEGLYHVSNLGRVKALYYKCKKCKNWNIKKNPKIIRCAKDKHGYYFVRLYNGEKQNRYSVHRLVAMVFLPNPLNLSEVNHKDENPVNNLVDNLEWCSHKYNMNYGTKVKRQKEKVSKPVCQYTLNEVFIKEYPSRKEASIETGTDVTGICQCIKGKLKTSGGFIWKNGRKL